MKVLVTAGPTREALDPVRFISNRSSGKMGYAVAEAALRAGHEVVLVSGPVALAPPRGARLVPVTTAAEMLAAVRRCVRGCDLLVMAAAVADWRPRHPARRKLKKRAGPPRIAWEAAPDVLAEIAPLKKPAQVFCGFAAETHALAREAGEVTIDPELGVGVDDFVFLRPTQSEAVMLQFGPIAVLSGGAVVDFWEPFAPTA